LGEARFYYQNEHAPRPNKPAGIGVVAIIRRDDGILLEKRSDSDRWAIIGGGVQEHESLTDALRREVKEETGLTVRGVKLFGTFSDPSRIAAFPDGNVKRIITIAYEVEVEPFSELGCSEESKEVRFIPAGQLHQLPIAETHLPIIQSIVTGRSVILE